MKKLLVVLHYIVLILIVALVVFSGVYIYNRSNKKDQSQYIANKPNIFHNKTIKITSDMTKEKKSEVTKIKLDNNETKKVSNAKPIVKKDIKVIKSELIVKAKSKPKPVAKPKPKKVYNGKVLYFKNCKLCHGNLRMFTKKTNKDRLNKLFAQKAKGLSLLHEQSNVSKMTNKYFKSKEYELQIESIGKYIINYQ